MVYNIRGKNIEITEGMSNHIIDKLSKLDKYLDNVDNVTAQVLVRVYENQQKIEVTIPTKNYTLRIEEKHPDLYVAIDRAADKLERQIRKHKTRLQQKVYETSIKDFIFSEFGEEYEENEETVVKTKHLATKPMDIEEAILQMELLNHDFYVFRDMNSKAVNVIYRRKDGAYGLIETE